MKRMRKLTAALLALCLAAALAVPASASETASTFSDITDPTVAQAVEVLRMMGVMEGVGEGRFNPSGTLTRAEFCKMAVVMMGLGDKVPAYETRTIFPDVAYDHWARGYINLAVTTEVEGSRLILGVGNGTFAPNRTITYSEAVTVILRVLGYGEAAAVNWPAGAVATANSLDLTHDLGTVTAAGTLTRAQAAILFCNMLTCETFSGAGVYAATLGSVTPNSIITSVSATTADGSKGVAVSTLESPVKPAYNAPATFFLGRRGTVVLDTRGRFLTLIPDRSASSRTVTVSLASGTKLVASDGASFAVPPSARVMYNGIEAPYSEAYKSLNRAGLPVTIYFTAAGTVDYIFADSPASVSGRIAVADADGRNALSSIITGAGYTIVKNGSTAAASDIKKNDVGLFDEGRNTLYVTDFRVTGVYEGATPSPESPTGVTILGHEFTLADCALDSIDKVKVGTLVTALFSPDGKIARLAPSSEISSTAMAVLAPESAGSSVTLEVINAPIGLESISGTLPETSTAEMFKGEIVKFESTVSSSGAYLQVWKVGSDYTGALDKSTNCVGSSRISNSVTVFERVGPGGDLTRISLAEVAQNSVPMNKVSFTHRDVNGLVDILVLNDVTGDRYTYGIITTRSEQIDVTVDEDGKVTTATQTITTVTNSQGSVEVAGGSYFPSGFGGIAPTALLAGNIGGYRGAAGFASLTSMRGITQNDFDLNQMTITHNRDVFPIAPNVQCYNQRTGQWYQSLQECFLATNSFTVYYDRDLKTGGKIRVIVVE